jgi:hypothetical protein
MLAAFSAAQHCEFILELARSAGRFYAYVHECFHVT